MMTVETLYRELTGTESQPPGWNLGATEAEARRRAKQCRTSAWRTSNPDRFERWMLHARLWEARADTGSRAGAVRSVASRA